MESQNKKAFYTYILECSDKTLYTGYTTDIKKRVATHNLGKGAKYTRARLPVKLVYFEAYSSKEEATRREYAIKQLDRASKLEMIEAFDSEEIKKILDYKEK